MTPARRWCLVVAGTVLLVATPAALRALPADDTDVTAGALLELVESADGQAWSGYVVTEGNLQLPDADRFNSVTALLGEQTRMRAWWQDDDHWRVAELLIGGERDLHGNDGTTIEWDYEQADATISDDPDIRLPRSSDLLPPVLGERLLRDASAADATRLPARRVAGIDAPGLRLEPSSELSSIGHADLWADPESGVPLRVEVYADGDDAPSFTSAFLDFSSERPDDPTVSFSPAPRVELDQDDVLDIADAANQYAPVTPPSVVAGLEKSATSDRAVGVYGEGMTQLIVIPLRDREADALRDQLVVTLGVVRSPGRLVVSVGPLGVVLTGPSGQGGWLLAGTLTRDALARAAGDVESGFVYLGDDR